MCVWVWEVCRFSNRKMKELLFFVVFIFFEKEEVKLFVLSEEGGR